MKKSEITNQELLQAISQSKEDILIAVNQNIDQKLNVQKDEILAVVGQKLSAQKEEILTAMDSKTGEILDAVLKTAELDEQRFQKIETSLSGIENRLSGVEIKLSGVETRLGAVEGTINTQMVTKQYLDDKFAEFGVEHNNKHKRVDKLTNILHKKKILNVAETRIVLAN